jgi:hypothetical protein
VDGRNKSGHDAASLELEQLLRIAVRDAFAVTGADRDLIEEGAGGFHGVIRVIRREHDAVDTDLE